MQILINGMIAGLTAGLAALAFSVVYVPARVLYIALGGIYAAAPYITRTCLQAGWPWPLAVIATLLTGIAISLACELLNHAPLERRRASPGAHLISSLGIYIILVQVIALMWGNDVKVLRTGLDATVRAGDIIITRAQILAGMGSLALIAGFFVWLKFSNLGLQFRALADNPTELALRGYNIRRLRLLAFGMSGVLGSASALLMAYDIGFDPHGGLLVILLAIVATIIGGRDSFVGPVLGGVLLGVVRSEVVWILSSRWQEAVTFLLLVLFLYIRPGGLLSRKVRLEAEV